MSQITAAVVSFQAADALALTIESFRKFHGAGIDLWVYDNGSTDGAKEYAEAHADRVFYGDNQLAHGDCLSIMFNEVQTPYFLAMDNDLEFFCRAVDAMQEAIEPEDVYCSCFTRLGEWGTAHVHGVEMQSMWSPNIALGLMKTDVVRKVHDTGLSFGNYTSYCRREYFETGGMVWRAAVAMGYRVAELPDLWHMVKHYGGASSYFLPSTIDPNQANPEYRSALGERYAVISERLAELRMGT